MPRLFLAVFPPQDTINRLGELERPEVEGLRWTGPEQWHITLRFLGEAEQGDAEDSLRDFRGSASTVRLGPASRRLGARALVLPADGLRDLAAEVRVRTEAVGQPLDRRDFTGHLTLALASGSPSSRGCRGRWRGSPSRPSSRPASCGWYLANFTPTERATPG